MLKFTFFQIYPKLYQFLPPLWSCLPRSVLSSHTFTLFIRKLHSSLYSVPIRYTWSGRSSHIRYHSFSPQLPQHIFLGENIQEGNFLSNFINFGLGLSIIYLNFLGFFQAIFKLRDFGLTEKQKVISLQIYLNF